MHRNGRTIYQRKDVFDINHVERKHMRAVNSKGVVGGAWRRGVIFHKDNLIYDPILFHKTNTLDNLSIPAYLSSLFFSFFFYKISFLSLNNSVVYIYNFYFVYSKICWFVYVFSHKEQS